MQRPSLIFFCKYNFIAHKNYLLRVLIFVTAFGIISCTKNKQLSNNIFKYNEYSNISSLDPAFSSTLRNIWPVNQIFNGLVKLDENLEIIDDLAHRWEISPDKKTYTFVLKKDIKFHPSRFFNNESDRIVNADDFVYSLKRLTDPKVASSGSWVLKNVDSIYSVNDSILKIELTKEFKPFLGILSMKYCSVVPREVVENFGDEFGQNPIGTGPFLFKKWDQNIKLVLRKNDEYFEKDIKGKKLPYLDGISISLIPDKKSEFMDPFSPNTLMSLAVTYHLSRNSEQSVKILKRYLELDPKNHQALRMSIQGAGATGDKAFAYRVLELMKEHNPAAAPLAESFIENAFAD